ncbi:type IV pilin [Halobacteriales archaeon QS_8_69_26]|nr:MAG: type IV pilin [Halobacteriales archaeon QS_8_69_26]
MHTRGLVTDRRAVSPVIGVILLVAIPVILGTVVGTFVLGFGAGDPTPEASFEYERIKEGSVGNPDEVLIRHVAGDAIPNDELYVTADVPVQEASGSPGPAKRLPWRDLGDGGEDVKAQDSVDVDPPNSDPEIEDTTFRIGWDDGERNRVVISSRKGSEIDDSLPSIERVGGP